MRFRFCGDLDCPDWVLAEISTLAKMSSVKMKLLCVQVLKGLLGEGIDYDKVTKLTADAKFESGDIKASVAVLSFIYSSAAKHDVDSESLSSELQQLGLPKGWSTKCLTIGPPILEIDRLSAPRIGIFTYICIGLFFINISIFFFFTSCISRYNTYSTGQKFGRTFSFQCFPHIHLFVAARHERITSDTNKK
ncbi:COMM domain-containing protein 4-like [Entelurus aequoreus]|uniref:COMM domain-containing protein 4-like n=1 Tax=Entelurus aequoreus TaxID=161455 RepID=UPI002B1DA1A8|nr:COMM domain-containing protein 4-like [Entelurus aequoreus]